MPQVQGHAGMKPPRIWGPQHACRLAPIRAAGSRTDQHRSACVARRQLPPQWGDRSPSGPRASLVPRGRRPPYFSALARSKPLRPVLHRDW